MRRAPGPAGGSDTQKPELLEAGEPGAWRLEEDGADGGVVIEAEGPDGERREQRLGEVEVAVALMFLCQDLGIPLPCDAAKAIEVQDEAVVLRLTLE